MILIFSTSRDQATNGVVPWLDRLGRAYLRINDDEPCGDLRIEVGNSGFRFEIDGVWRADSDISAIWYRKGAFWFPSPSEAPVFEGQAPLSALLSRKLKDESRAAARFFHELVRRSHIRVLGNAVLGDPNKLILMSKAERLGLRVPRFEIVNSLSRDHLDSPSRYITKAMSDGVYLWDNDEALRGYFSYTEDLAEATVDVGPGETFPLSMVQEKIAKSFDVRVFYLEGRFAASAIYSQNDPQTSTDCRKYNSESPNRNVPISLPGEVEEKLHRLFEELELNTGSVDLIVDTDGEFVFLEINPVGIYGGMQASCNYKIDRAIAHWLSGENDHDWC